MNKPVTAVLVHTEAQVAYHSVGLLIGLLTRFDGDFDGPEGEVEEWINDLQEARGILDCIVEFTDDDFVFEHPLE